MPPARPGPNVRDFVFWLYDLSKVPSWAAFSRSSNVSAQTLSEVKTGKNKSMKAENLIKLMTTAGILRWEGWIPDDRAREVADEARRLEGLIDVQAEQLAQLRQELTRLGRSPREAVRLSGEG